MKYFNFLIIAFISINPTFCQDSDQDILNKFFELYKENTSDALNYIYSTNRWIDLEGDGIKQLRSQINQYKDLVGEYHGEEFIHKSELGECFVNYIYLAKYDRQPFRFTFELYKPKDEWLLYSFKFDDSFDSDLEEVMKFEYMQTKRGN